MDTGAKIKQLRESLDMTQEDLGRLLGVKKAAINKYETGTVVNLKRSTIENLCNIFNVTPQYLLSDSDLSQPSSSAPELELTEQEGRLLVTFRRLNKSQQERLIAYAEGMLDAGTSAVTDAFHHYGFMSAPVSKVSEGAAEYRCDVEQARREADEIVREEYKKAVKLKSGAK